MTEHDRDTSTWPFLPSVKLLTGSLCTKALQQAGRDFLKITVQFETLSTLPLLSSTLPSQVSDAYSLSFLSFVGIASNKFLASIVLPSWHLLPEEPT